MQIAPALSNILTTTPLHNPSDTSDTVQGESPPSDVSQDTLSDEMIIKAISQLPKQYLKIGKKLDDKILFEAIKGKFPQFDIFTINRAIKLYREHF